MVSFGEKAKVKKAGNLNYGRSYVNTTVLKQIEFAYRIMVLSLIPLNELPLLNPQV